MKKPSLLPHSAAAGWVWSLEIVQILHFWPWRGCSGSQRCHHVGMHFPCAGTSLANTRYPSFLPAPMVGIIAFGFSWLWKASKELSSCKLRAETESLSLPHLFVVIQLPPFTLWHNNGLKVKQEASSPPRLRALNETQPAGPIETASRQMSTLTQRGLNDWHRKE